MEDEKRLLEVPDSRIGKKLSLGKQQSEKRKY
jgi:hypothetical protein